MDKRRFSLTQRGVVSTDAAALPTLVVIDESVGDVSGGKGGFREPLSLQDGSNVWNCVKLAALSTSRVRRRLAGLAEDGLWDL